MNQVKLTFLLLIISYSISNAQFKSIEFDSDYQFSDELLASITDETPQWKYQIIASDFAKIGQDSLAMLYWDKAFGAREINLSAQHKDSINAVYSIKSAVDVIIEQAKLHEILIINEAHHMNQHRAFTAGLLDSLYAIGYRYVGLEALDNKVKTIEDLNERGYLEKKDGYYTQSPAFGKLVNHALKIGFELFAYEAQEGLNNGEREQGQADNIAEFMQNHKEGKVFIHCGFDHAMEGEHPKWDFAMAERLKELTGLNPLTIDQVQFSGRHQKSYRPALLQAIEPQVSVVLFNDGKLIGAKKGASFTDIAVMHPVSTEMKNSIALKGLEELGLSIPIQVLVYPAEANVLDAVPVTVKEYNQLADAHMLSLPPNRYQVIIRDSKMKGKAFLATLEIE